MTPFGSVAAEQLYPYDVRVEYLIMAFADVEVLAKNPEDARDAARCLDQKGEITYREDRETFGNQLTILVRDPTTQQDRYLLVDKSARSVHPCGMADR